jgi:hypothetical protein
MSVCCHVCLPQAVATEEERVKQRKADQEQRKAAAAAGSDQDAPGNQQPPHAAAAGSSSSSKPGKKANVDKTPSARPDRVAESSILRSGRAVNRLGRDTFGHLPGIPVNHV